MAKKTVADVLVNTIASAGVRNIYGIAGDALNGVGDSVRRQDQIKWQHVRHEESAAFAAGAEAHLTRKLAVCAGSSGPGNLHLINGLYDCHRSRVPVLAIAADIPSSEIGSGYFQETRPEHLFEQCSHYCERISGPDQVPRIVEIAIQTALSKSGVSVVVLPGDIALQQASNDKPVVKFVEPNTAVAPHPDQVRAVADALARAKKVTILAGAGCAGAHDGLMAVAGRLKAPIVHAMRGKEFIEYDNPYDVGMTGLLGFSSGYHAMMACDFLLMLGTDFPYRQFFPQDALIAQVDVRGEQIGRRTKIDFSIIGDVRSTIEALMPLIKERTDDGHLRQAVDHYRKTRRQLDELARPEGPENGSHPQYVTRVLDEFAADDAIFTCDVGTPTIWAARYLRMNGRRRLLGSFAHGSMANAMPQAIGAQVSHPGRQVIAMCGDGGFAMLMGDLLTMRQLNLPVKMIVYRNDAYSFVELEMKAAGLLDFQTYLKNPDFTGIAESAGVLGLRARNADEVSPAIERALMHDGPALVEAFVYRQELSMPPSIDIDQVKGFGLFAMKAILSGRGSEIVDLARVNVFKD